MGINLVIIDGRLAFDAKLLVEEVNPVCGLTIASNWVYKDGEFINREVSHFDIRAYGSLADACCTLKKGKEVRAIGHLEQQRCYDDDGKLHFEVVIVLARIELRP